MSEYSSSRQSDSYPGYPTERLIFDFEHNAELQNLTLPDGPWTHNNTNLPSFEEATSFTKMGYQTDDMGRPLHPWLSDMIASEGVVTGKGKFWNWGPNKTADPVVLTDELRPKVLLIRRADTGALALPGGFIDLSDRNDTQAAALRELQEETGLTLHEPGTLLYEGPVTDARATAHAWPETSAYLFTVETALPVMAGDDAKEADWYPVDELPETLFGSHALLIERALATRPITIVDAGHMAYDHYFTHHKGDHLFVKSHDPSRFDDPVREAHSRSYLAKEKMLYDHLKNHEFEFLPEQVFLVDDRLLAMTALSSEDGWRWRAPEGAYLEKYIADTLHAFEHLQQTPSPHTNHTGEPITPTHTTLWEEGWDTIDDTQHQAIVHRIRSLSQNWSETQRLATEQLIASLPQLRQDATIIDRHPSLFLSHNDARQSNIAWHPDHGVRLVDWSWGDDAPHNADATMFLIDLQKSGHDTSAHLTSVNSEHALTLIGFWLAHSLWKTKDGSDTVREQQIASAVASFTLLHSRS